MMTITLRTFVSRALALALVGAGAFACSISSGEHTGEVESAAMVGPNDGGAKTCDLANILKVCTTGDTPYIGKKSLNPLGGVNNGTGTPSITNPFDCANFAGSFCRCAEMLCPGSVGRMLYQQTVYCTLYYNCDFVTWKHAMNIVCEPNADGTTKKCSCVEPQSVNSLGDGKPIQHSATFGINEDPPGDFCQAASCDAKLGAGKWKGCGGGKTYSSCDNVNGTDGCPGDCCVNANGATPAHCTECNKNLLKVCGKKPEPGKLQCVTCSAGGHAPRCEGTKIDDKGNIVPNGVLEPCGDFGFLKNGLCPGPGTGWSDATGPYGCTPRSNPDAGAATPIITEAPVVMDAGTTAPVERTPMPTMDGGI